MHVINDKLKEALQFGWEMKETFMNLFVDNRSTSHSMTNISPFEVMFGKKMEVKLTNFLPAT